MKINLEKKKKKFCKTVVHLNNWKWFDKGSLIDVVSFYTYLGMYFTPTLVQSKTKYMLSKQALKAISNILNYQRNFGRFDSKDMFKLFDATVKPIFLLWF